MRDRFGWLTRLLGQLRLWQQFVLLGLFVVLVPIISTTLRFLADGRNILTEHETIDLSDESNLRVDEIREEFDVLVRELQTQARSMGADLTPPRGGVLVAPPEKILEDRLKDWASRWPSLMLPPGSIPKSVSQVRLRYFRDALDSATVVSLKPALKWSSRVYGNGNLSKGEVLPDAVELQAVQQLSERMTRKVPSYLSGLHLQTSHGSPRCLIAVGRPIRWDQGNPVEMLVVFVDFSQYLRNRARTSPRHQYLVTTASSQLLVHPKPELVRQHTPATEATQWRFPSDSWPATTEDDLQRNARHAKMVRNGGLRLTGVPVPALRHFYTKGYFGGELGLLLGDNSAATIAELNTLLHQISEEDSFFRYGEVTQAATYLELSHPDSAKLQALMNTLTEWWNQIRSKKGHELDWSDALDCVTFQGQLTHLRLDLNEDDEPPRLIVAASLEELRQDIDTRFTRIVWRWVIPTVAVAVAITIGLIFLLTRSLQKLAQTASTLTDPEAFVHLKSGSCKEVEELQSALLQMATRLSDDTTRYSTILRTAGEGILVTNPEGLIEVANRAAAQMFGFPSAEALQNVDVQALLEDPLPATIRMSSDAPRPNREALRGKRQDGSLFWLEVTTRPVSLKDRMIMTCIFRDVSQRKAQEEQIQRMNEELESRVKLRTAELAEANTKLEVALKQAEAASKAKDAFVANMSHELRQPLHIIIGFTEALKEEATDAGRTELIPDLNKILTAAKHLLELINDILDLAKIAAGRMELSFSKFAVPQMMTEVKTLVGPLAERNNNRFEVEASPEVGEMVADERRVRQMLINLLSNAFKFTNQGVVKLQAEKVQQEGRDWVRFTVQDSGKGMTAEQVSRLFQRFYQADASTTREAGGTGLGLAITQSFNELMKGLPIEVQSETGQGSRFSITLPVDVQAASPVNKSLPRVTVSRTTPESLPASGAGGLVLVIDDDPMVQELMKRFLMKEGFQVVVASSGPEGLRLASELKPVAITLDVMMPGTDGWAVLASLKLNAETCDIPVVMLTIVDDRGRGFALGAADYLTKPIDWQRLGAILKKYLPSDRNSPVLVIDDDPECRNIVERYLSREGWRIVLAEDGEAGLHAYAQEAPALILLDLMMPQLDGFGFLDELTKRFPASQTPVIILTAKELTAEDFDRLNGRVAKILEKNQFEQLEELLKLVRRHARHRGPLHDEATDRG